MPTHTLRLTPVDVRRIEVLRDRAGREASASLAVRVALSAFFARRQRDVIVEAEQLAQEWRDAGETVVRSVYLAPDEAAMLGDAAADPPVGVKRRFSRTEIVRLALLLFERAADRELEARFVALRSRAS